MDEGKRFTIADLILLLSEFPPSMEVGVDAPLGGLRRPVLDVMRPDPLAPLERCVLRIAPERLMRV